MEKLSTLHNLLEEESKGSRLQIPSSLQEAISTFQEAYRERNNRKISREHVVLLMMAHGAQGLAGEAAILTEESAIPA